MKKGFTLVELLAVVVILALIALIATPVILNIKKSVEMGAFKASAYGILRSADLYYTSNVISTGEKIASINVLEKDSNGEYLLRYEGQAPEQGIIMYNENSKSALSMKQDIWCAQKDYDDEEIKVYEVGKDGDCLLPGEEPTLKDENPGIICGISDIEEYDLYETCYIKSVEDLVAFSNLVNSGKTFKNKNVMIVNVKDQKHLNVYREHRFYHIPKSSLSKVKLGVEYLAFYQPQNKFGKDSGICYYAKIKDSYTYKRGSCIELECDNGKEKSIYIRFDLEEFEPISKISTVEYGVRNVMYTTLYLLKNATTIHELSINNRKEIEVYKILKKISKDKNLPLEKREDGYKLQEDYIKVYNNDIRVNNELVEINDLEALLMDTSSN